MPLLHLTRTVRIVLTTLWVAAPALAQVDSNPKLTWESASISQSNRPVGAMTDSAANQKKLKVWNERTESGFRFFVSSLDQFPRTLHIRFDKLINFRATEKLPISVVVEGKMTNRVLFDIDIIDTSKRSRLAYTACASFGDYRTAMAGSRHVYLLPFEHGTQHYVCQGYGGKFTHSTPGQEYALDFAFPDGTVVCAARAGVVVDLKEDSNRGGSSEKYADDGNFITILHEDGSMATYGHLQQHGVHLEVGESVNAGQRIGLSGHTGFATGPHLHLEILVPEKTGDSRSIPTRFLQQTGTGVTLKEGETYEAFHPNKLAFNALQSAPE